MRAVSRIARALAVPAEETGFTRGRTGWAIAVLNTLMALNSTNFFLGMLKTGVANWFMMNTCAPSIALFVAGFLLASPVVMTAGALLMFRYGTLGLFVFSWSGGNLFAQAGHIAMTLAVVYVVVDAVRKRGWKTVGLGLLLGIAILFPLEIAQTTWLLADPETAVKLFRGDFALPGK